MSEITVKVYEASSPLTLIDELANSKERQWLDEFNDTGSGSLKLHVTDAILAANPGILAYDNIVRIALHDVDRFAWIIERRDLPPAPRDEHAGRNWNVAGRGVLAVLEDAIVYPEAVLDSFARQRAFDFTAIAYEDSSWIAATEIQRVGVATGDITAWRLKPNGWPFTPNAYWIWSQPLDFLDVHPPGTSYFRRVFTAFDDATMLSISATCDNAFRLWLDGELLLEGDDWSTTYHASKRVSDGTHVVAVEATNVQLPSGFAGPAGLAVVIHQADENGNPLSSVTTVKTDSSWQCLDYPVDVPGMSIGQIMRVLVEEAQARGALPGVTLDFTDTDDSNGDDWGGSDLGDGFFTINIVFDIGTPLLQVLRTLVEQFVDARMSPDLVLSIYNKGNLGSDLTGTIDLRVGEDEDFEELNASGEGLRTNAILGRDTTGLLTMSEDATSLAAHKRKETYLELATSPNEQRAQGTIGELLIEFAEPVVQLSGVVTEESGPYTDWRTGDTILMPNLDGDPTDTTIVSIGVEEDDAGHPIFNAEGMQDDGTA